MFDKIDEKSRYIDDIKILIKNLDYKVVTIFISVSILLLLQHYLASRSFTRKMFKDIVSPEHLEIFESVGWCGLVFLFYFVIPFIIIKFIFKEKVSDYGLSIKGLKSHWLVYLTLFMIVFPLVIVASFSPAFQHTYPFYGYVSKGIAGLLIWELAYGFQFLSVEFLFRGYIIFGLKEKFGLYSIFIMVIPYCMIHFPKPMGEAIGAIFAGMILGYFAMKSRSVWGGVFLHWFVAITMDLSSILQK